MFPSTIKQCIIVSVPPFFICLVACLKHVATVSQTLVYLSRGMLKARRNRTHIIFSANLQRRAKVKNKEHIVTTDTHTHTHTPSSSSSSVTSSPSPPSLPRGSSDSYLSHVSAWTPSSDSYLSHESAWPIFILTYPMFLPTSFMVRFLRATTMEVRMLNRATLRHLR